jgi:hypothetical protein
MQCENDKFVEKINFKRVEEADKCQMERLPKHGGLKEMNSVIQINMNLDISADFLARLGLQSGKNISTQRLQSDFIIFQFTQFID